MKRFALLSLLSCACTLLTVFFKHECGNNVIDRDFGELCDDNNTADGDGCSASCALEFCGDGELQSTLGELCDDGNTDNNDGCRSDCAGLEVCQDGLIDVNEECDDGNQNDLDECKNDCALPFCGDALISTDLGETCEDGNTSDNDGCSALCIIERCGDAVLQLLLGEECDDGNAINDDSCTNGCNFNRDCGNNFSNPGEICLSDVTATITGTPKIVSLSDFDGDADLDIAIITQSPNQLTLLFNDGAGQFVESADPAQTKKLALSFTPVRLATGDLDGDGLADAVITDTTAQNAKLFHNDGAGTMSAASNLLTNNVVPLTPLIAQIDNQGPQDLVLLSSNVNVPADRQVQTFISTGFSAGQFTFTPKTAQPVAQGSFNAVIGDFDQDNFADVLTTSSSGSTVTAVPNDATDPGDFAFPIFSPTLTPLGSNPLEIAVGDIEGDGDPDALIGIDAPPNRVQQLTNLQNAAVDFLFEVLSFPSLAAPVRGLAMADVDGDTLQDAIAGDSQNNRIAITLSSSNNQQLTLFRAVSGAAVSLVIGDVNGDNDPDIVVATQSLNALSIFLSDH